MKLVLHSAKRASAPYRVRIGLNLKGLAYQVVPVDLLAGEQRGEAFRDLNPFGGVPALEFEGIVRAQSMPLLEWLDERFPEHHPLLPGDAQLGAAGLHLRLLVRGNDARHCYRPTRLFE